MNEKTGNYYKLTSSQDEALEYWKKSQYDLADIVLALTDQGIMEGLQFYDMFKREEFLAMMQVAKLNFALIKKKLGINGEYVERKGDVYSENFNPKRNFKVLKYMDEDLKKVAKEVLDEFMKNTEGLANYIASFNNKNQGDKK